MIRELTLCPKCLEILYELEDDWYLCRKCDTNYWKEDILAENPHWPFSYDWSIMEEHQANALESRGCD